MMNLPKVDIKTDQVFRREDRLRHIHLKINSDMKYLKLMKTKSAFLRKQEAAVIETAEATLSSEESVDIDRMDKSLGTFKLENIKREKQKILV